MKKVLIIAYYWPPAGGPGVQRWLKFVKYLPHFDIEPIVYVPDNPHYPIEDATLATEIPKEVVVHKQPIFEPYRLASLVSSKKTKRISSGIIQTKNPSVLEKTMLWVRGNFFIPDARKYWVKPSVKYISALLEREQIDTIITTGPPHSVHLIGVQLKQHRTLRWIADFRDPWTSIGYHKKLRLTGRSQKKHKALEHLVLNRADCLLVTSQTTKDEFAAITEKPISVITNGFDSDYRGGAHLDERFTIAHIGSLLAGRNPKNLWKALSDLASENELFRAALQIEFIGVVSQEVMASLYRYELGPYIKLKGYVSHKEAMRKQRQAQLLLLIEIDSEETKGIIPGKLFEYMAARRPILGVGPQEWEAGQLIRNTNTGAVFNYEDSGTLKDLIRNWFENYRDSSLHLNAKNIEKYSRKALTEQLAKTLQWE